MLVEFGGFGVDLDPFTWIWNGFGCLCVDVEWILVFFWWILVVCNGCWHILMDFGGFGWIWVDWVGKSWWILVELGGF